MRVRNGDGAQTSQCTNSVYARLVNETEAVPKNVAVGALDQEGALADREIRRNLKAVDASGFLTPGHIMPRPFC